MTDLAQFLDWLATAFPIVVILGGLLGLFYKEKLKQILARSMAKEVEELRRRFAIEAAELTAKLERDLEAYRVSLIAEAERVKARQEIKTSVALRIAEKRYLAIATLHDAHMGMDVRVASHLRINLPNDQESEKHFSDERSKIIARFDAYTEALNNATLFLSLDLRQSIVDFRSILVSALPCRNRASDPPLPPQDPILDRLMRKSLEVESSLLGLIKEMEQFGE